jgi:hypothetical protein
MAVYGRFLNYIQIEFVTIFCTKKRQGEKVLQKNNMVVIDMDESEQALVIAILYERMQEALPDTGEFLDFLAGKDKISNLLDCLESEIKKVLNRRDPKRLC